METFSDRKGVERPSAGREWVRQSLVNHTLSSQLLVLTSNRQHLTGNYTGEWGIPSQECFLLFFFFFFLEVEQRCDVVWMCGKIFGALHILIWGQREFPMFDPKSWADVPSNKVDWCMWISWKMCQVNRTVTWGSADWRKSAAWKSTQNQRNRKSGTRKHSPTRTISFWPAVIFNFLSPVNERKRSYLCQSDNISSAQTKKSDA